MPTVKAPEKGPVPVRRLARRVFFAFLLTFITARVLVILIMTRRLPNLFLHARGSHIHHLNYGIFLLALAGAVLVFVTQPSDSLRKFCAVIYGIGMALTFDEFGMWLHLGGSYWQRGSFDAVVVILSVFGGIAYLPKLSRMRTLHWTITAVSALAVIAFYLLLFSSAKTIGARFGPHLQNIEESGPQ
ncbi:MAG: hypothetical protein ABI992_03370 [Chthoniobacterales bacterium]